MFFPSFFWFVNKPGEQTSGTTTAAAGPSSSVTAPSSSSSPAPQRRLQRVEILKIAEGTPLIDPTEVVVSQGAVLTAEPVLTPLGKFHTRLDLKTCAKLIRETCFLQRNYVGKIRWSVLPLRRNSDWWLIYFTCRTRNWSAHPNRWANPMAKKKLDC